MEYDKTEKNYLPKTTRNRKTHIHTEKNLLKSKEWKL